MSSSFRGAKERKGRQAIASIATGQGAKHSKHSSKHSRKHRQPQGAIGTTHREVRLLHLKPRATYQTLQFWHAVQRHVSVSATQFEISSAQMFVIVQLFGTSCKIGIHNGGALSHKVGCHNFVHVLPCLVDWCSWYQQVGKAPRCGPSILQSRVDIMANGCGGMGVSIWPAHNSCAIP